MVVFNLAGVYWGKGEDANGESEWEVGESAVFQYEIEGRMEDNVKSIAETLGKEGVARKELSELRVCAKRLMQEMEGEPGKELLEGAIRATMDEHETTERKVSMMKRALMLVGNDVKDTEPKSFSGEWFLVWCGKVVDGNRTLKDLVRGNSKTKLRVYLVLGNEHEVNFPPIPV